MRFSALTYSISNQFPSEIRTCPHFRLPADKFSMPDATDESCPIDSSANSCVCVWRQLLIYTGIGVVTMLAGLAIQRLQGVDAKYLDPDGWGQRGFWLAEGRGLLDAEGNPSAQRGPVVPLLFATAAWLAGPTFGALLFVQAIFFGLSGSLFACIAQTIFGRWRVSLTTVAMMIAFLPAWPWLCNIFSEPIFTALMAAFVLVWIHTLAKPESAWRWLMLGVLLVLVALTRPVMYFFVPVVMLDAIWRFGLKRQVGLSLAWMLLGFALLEVPWVIRNQMVLGQTILMTQGTSQALHLATFYQEANWTDNVYHDPERFPPAGEGFWQLPKEEQDQRFREMAWENFQNAPGKVLMLIPKRFLIFFFQLPATGWIPTVKSLILTGILYPTVIVGFWLAGPARRRLYQPCLILVLFNAAFYTLLQSEYRYSHPIQPYIMMLSAYGLWAIAERLLAFVRPPQASPAAK